VETGALVKCVIDCTPDPEIKSLRVLSAVNHAFSFGEDKQILQLLDVARFNEDILSSILHQAASQGYYDIARLLLDDYQVDVNAQQQLAADTNVPGDSTAFALQAASFQGHESLVRLLLARGANVNTTGGQCYTALQEASVQGHTSIMVLLLDAGADVNAKGGGYGSALQAASARGNTLTVQLLLVARADANKGM
jgi:ankyrin repeat protein